LIRLAFASRFES